MMRRRAQSDRLYIFGARKPRVYIRARAYIVSSIYSTYPGPSLSPLALICRYLGAGGQIYRGGYINVAKQ